MKLYQIEIEDDDWGEEHYVLALSFEEAESKVLKYLEEHPNEEKDDSILDEDGSLNLNKKKREKKVISIMLLSDKIIK